MNRRQFVAMSAAAAAVAATRPALGAEASNDATALHVEAFARDLAQKPYAAVEPKVHPAVKDIGYDQYRDIRFRADAALWHGEDLGFEIQFFPTAYIYHDPVEMFVVDERGTTPLRLTADMFNLGPLAKSVPRDAEFSFSGFRIHVPFNGRDYRTELAVFQGASYFRSLAHGQGYGLSARGLALKTGIGEGLEEFPVFRSFWIEKPQDRQHLTLHALLDSPSAAGAFRFVIEPAATTIMDIDATLFPRVDITHAGIAPLTSMFLFDTNEPPVVPDFRPAVHDSDGLSMLSSDGRRLWRPLVNPRSAVNIEAIDNATPKGFGLMQRERDFAAYQDLEAVYEKRPSAWVEPVNDWGAGHIELVEIPQPVEYFDNIVAYWRPVRALAAGGRHRYSYRLFWCEEAPGEPPAVRVGKTRAGQGSRPGTQRFVIDYEGLVSLVRQAGEAVGLASSLAESADSAEAVVAASAGTVSDMRVEANPHTGGLRVIFTLDPGAEQRIALRLDLTTGRGDRAETWLYRWVR